jgi:hypothetical protein
VRRRRSNSFFSAKRRFDDQSGGEKRMDLTAPLGGCEMSLNVLLPPRASSCIGAAYQFQRSADTG